MRTAGTRDCCDIVPSVSWKKRLSAVETLTFCNTIEEARVDSMVPEAQSKAKQWTGLATVLGFALAAGLSFAS